MAEVVFTVPGVVRGKGRPRATSIGGHARMYTDAKTRSYEAEVKFFAMQAMAGKSLMDGPLAVEMTARFAPPASASKRRREAMLNGYIHPTTKPDTDNVAKVKDALNGVIFMDDKQVVVETVRKIYAAEPGLEIRVRTIVGEPA